MRTAFGLLHASPALDVTLAPGGKIVAAGFVQTGGDANGSTRFAVARYLPDGRLDTSFSRDGRATVDFGYGPDQACAVATQRKRSRRSPASAVPSAPGARRSRPVP